jgi:hypothetical protein
MQAGPLSPIPNLQSVPVEGLKPLSRSPTLGFLIIHMRIDQNAYTSWAKMSFSNSFSLSCAQGRQISSSFEWTSKLNNAQWSPKALLRTIIMNTSCSDPPNVPEWHWLARDVEHASRK